MLILFSLIGAIHSYACTAVSLQGWGVTKSFDWTDPDGKVDPHGFLLVNARNTQKTALLLAAGTAANWTSRLGSVTFHQIGREFPYSGINEKGLVVEILQHRVAEPAESAMPAINEIQWIQYILDGAETLAQAKELASQVQVQPKFGVHYFVCDATSACAVFEFVANERGEDHFEAVDVRQHPVITNDGYGESLEFLSHYVGFGGQAAIPADESSISRFVRGAGFAGAVPEGVEAEARAWAGLTSVFNSMTAWQIAYQPVASKFTYRIHDAKALGEPYWLEKREIHFDPASVDYRCKQPRKMLDLETVGAGGNVTAQMVPYSDKFNRTTLDRNAFLGGFQGMLLRNAIAAYKTRCVE